MELSFNERRVLGVLMEKAFTTPDQYPLTLNSLVTACNQKSCRSPIVQLGEDDVLDALDDLRRHSLVSIIQTAGGRTDRWRHRARDTLEVSGPEAAILVELLLRGPQTDGELRQNSRRMSPLDSIHALKEVVDRLGSRPEALVVRLGPEHRNRGVRFAHTLYPAEELERIKEREMSAAPPSSSTSTAPASGARRTVEDSTREQIDALRTELAELRTECDALRNRVQRLETAVGD